MMYAGRFIGGLGVGSVSLLVPMYISELSPPDIRGFLVGMWEIGGQISAMAGFWVNFAVLSTMRDSSAQWMLSLGIQLVPGGLLFLASIFILPESPRFHVKKFKPEKAKEILAWLRQLPPNHEYITTELGAMQQQVDRELVQAPSKLRMMREIFWEGNRNRLGMGVLLMICQNTTYAPSPSFKRTASPNSPMLMQWYQRSQLLLPFHLPLHRLHGHQRLPLRLGNVGADQDRLHHP
jgi:MFS family permease